MFLHKKLFQKTEKSDSQNVEQVIKAIQQQQLSFQQKQDARSETTLYHSMN